MKTQIIYLDPHDDQISTKDKLGWVKAPRAVLVWPNRGRILTRRLDLVLLQRYAHEHNMQLGLVTHDPDVRNHAELLGIPVFDSMRSIPDDGWHRRTRLQAKRALKPSADREGPPQKPQTQREVSVENSILRAAIAFLAICAVTLAFGAILPSAEVTLSPELEPRIKRYELLLDPEIQQPDRAGSIPAKRVQIKVSESMRKPASGHVRVPITHAEGEVLFTNLTDEPISLGEGTILEASREGDVQFETLDSVDLPGEEGAQATARVRAVKAGNAGNVTPGAIDALQGPIGLKVAVENPQPTTGGSETNKPAVAKTDIETLEEELKQKIIEAAVSRVREGMQADEELHEPSLVIRQVYSRSSDRKVGEPAETVGFTLEVEIEALTYSSNHAASAASTLLAADLDEGVHLVPESLRIRSRASLIDETSGNAAIRVEIAQDTYRAIDFEKLKQALRFQPPEEATDWILQTYNLSDAPRIDVHPSWIPRLPWLAMRIHMQYAWES